MQVFIFLLSLAHVMVLFASAIALTIFVLLRLTKWLWRIAGSKEQARKPVKRLRKKPLSPVSETSL